MPHDYTVNAPRQALADKNFQYLERTIPCLWSPGLSVIKDTLMLVKNWKLLDEGSRCSMRGVFARLVAY